MDSNKNQTKIRVLMFPWLAYGHISPYLELAKKLSSRNFITYLCSTPATLSCIEKTITPKWSESIKLVPLHLPLLPELPKHLHTTNGLPPHLMPKLKEALDLSEPEFTENILGKIKPDLLIYDFLQPWAAASAKKQNIPAVLFNTSSSTSVSYAFHYFMNPSTVDYPYPKIYYRDPQKMKELLECDEKNKAIASEGFERSCDIILIKGFRGIEAKYIDYVGSLLGKKFVPVGPLVQEPNFNVKDETSDDVLSWLDKKEKKSTILISFGSEYFLSQEDISQIACGLELSEVNFIWVLRFPKGSNGVQNGENKIPELPLGFVERVGDKGKIVEGWAPQTRILGHANVGGFVSHCGWNSVMESMNYGVPIIALPMHLDQPLNARLVEEVGVGIEVLRDENNRISGDNLAKVIKEVVVEDCGEFVRKKAAEMRDKIKEDGDQETDEVVKELVKLCSKS